MKAITSDALDVIDGLIQICKDGQAGFREAARCIKGTELKTHLSACSIQRAQFAGELQSAAQGLGEHDPEDSGHTAATIHRVWIELKSAISGNDPYAILAECERGEDVAMNAYESALEEYLPADIRQIVEWQAGEVKAAHDRIKALRNALKNKQTNP